MSKNSASDEGPEELGKHESLPDGGPSIDDVRNVLGNWSDGTSIEKGIERNARDAMHQDEPGDDYWMGMHAGLSYYRDRIMRHLNNNQFYRHSRGRIEPPV